MKREGRRTNFGGVGLEVKRHPGGGKGIIGIGVQLLVGRDRLFELLLTHRAPWTHGIANDFDVELGHCAKTGAEHAGGGLMSVVGLR